MSLIVIGLTGPARVGKSTVARHLAAEWCGVRRPFAAPLKRMLARLLSDQGCDDILIRDMLEGVLKEAPSEYFGGRSPRHAMQTLGTEWGRGLASAYWVDVWLRGLAADAPRPSADGSTRLVIADDVRFPQEVAAIRALGGLVVRIVRPGAGLAGAAGAHASETTDLGEPDMTIVNDGTLDWLQRQADAIAANVME